MGWLDSIFKRKQKAWHHIFDVGDDNFEVQVLQRSFKQPILIDFWAAWCGPCRQLGPVLERIAAEPDSKVLLAKLDTSENQRTAQQFGIQSIPTVFLMRNGTVVGKFQGVQMEQNIRRFIDEKTEQPAPKPRLNIPKKPAQRLKQAKQQLARGNGFTAALLLQDFPDGDLSAEADKLLATANFVWDIADGDGMTGNAQVDELYIDMLEMLETKRGSDALKTLEAAVKVVAPDDRIVAAEALGVFEGILAVK